MGVDMTVASMTGFGRASGPLSERLSASVVVRSVNHRFLDVQVRTNLREELPELEAVVRGRVAGPLERGRVTVQVDLEWLRPCGAGIQLDAAAVASLAAQLSAVDLPGGVASEVRLGELLAVPGMVVVARDQLLLDDGELERLVGVVENALGQFVEMRRQEGDFLVAQLRDELARVGDFLDWLEPEIPGLRAAVLARLRERLARLLGTEAAVDEARLVQEAGLLADRADIGEELVRLRAHLAGFRQRLDDGGAVGRTLDFLCQEILRELNTLGAKCREAGVGDRLVEAKTATERLREQVQNLE